MLCVFSDQRSGGKEQVLRQSDSLPGLFPAPDVPQQDLAAAVKCL